MPLSTDKHLSYIIIIIFFAFQESYSKKRGYALETIPSAPLDAVPSENDNSFCDSVDIAVTKKPCSLEIARVPSSRPGKSPNNSLPSLLCKCNFVGGVDFHLFTFFKNKVLY